MRKKLSQRTSQAEFLMKPYLADTPVELPARDAAAVICALEETAGAWSDRAHPHLTDRETVNQMVHDLRASFDRGRR